MKTIYLRISASVIPYPDNVVGLEVREAKEWVCEAISPVNTPSTIDFVIDVKAPKSDAVIVAEAEPS